MIVWLFVFMPLTLQYIACVIEDPGSFRDEGSVELEYQTKGDNANDDESEIVMMDDGVDDDGGGVRGDGNVNPSTMPIIDMKGLQSESDGDDGSSSVDEGMKLIAAFINAYCASKPNLPFCITYNHCKNKTACSTNEFLDDNTDLISSLMSQFTAIDDTHKLIELTDKMHDWTKFALVGVIVILKVIISYLLERKFNICGKLKTSIREKKKRKNNRNSDYNSVADDDDDNYDDAEELKIMVSNPPAPVLTHANATMTKGIDIKKSKTLPPSSTNMPLYTNTTVANIGGDYEDFKTTPIDSSPPPDMPVYANSTVTNDSPIYDVPKISISDPPTVMPVAEIVQVESLPEKPPRAS